VVVELPEGVADLPFKVGDRVAARFFEKPNGALGEYALVSHKVADKVPDEISSVEAAALVSATPATLLADYIQPGERVLVIGGGGPIGSHFCQVVRERGASFCAGTSRAPDRLLAKPLSYDAAIDYTQRDVFAMSDYQENKFDVIVDLAGYGFAHLEQDAAKKIPLICKTSSQGGRFITFVPPDGPIFEAHSIWQLLKVFVFPILGKVIKSRLWARGTLPKYSFAFCLPSTRECVTRTLELVQANKLKAVIDGPFEFTTEGVRAAFRRQESRHAQGKVVIKVKEND
jgi:NADPH:quinone reductase-like Zn-dependent oxidoreductase